MSAARPVIDDLPHSFLPHRARHGGGHADRGGRRWCRGASGAASASGSSAALVNEARLAAETLSHRQPATSAELDAEADALGRLVSARVTFIAPDGTRGRRFRRVDAEALLTLENHAIGRKSSRRARSGLGVARRYSATLDIDMLYVAVPVRNPAAPMLSEVRLALPLTDDPRSAGGAAAHRARRGRRRASAPRCCWPGSGRRS